MDLNVKFSITSFSLFCFFLLFSDKVFGEMLFIIHTPRFSLENSGLPFSVQKCNFFY